jgi:hypothetical protein
VKNLLKYLRVRDEPLTFGDQTLEQAARLSLVRMVCADPVHRDTRVDEDQDSAPLSRYPDSI